MNSHLLPVTIVVDHMGKVLAAQDAARKISENAGFTEVEAEQLAIVASELSTNLIKHARGGLLRFEVIEDGERRGVEILSEDGGPGIVDIEQAMTDGYSTAGGLGNGLGTINRLMDEIHTHQLPSGGLQLLCRRWLRQSQRMPLASLVDFGAATRPRRGETANGDAFLFRRWDDRVLVGIIDGLGHGPEAEKAARLARVFVEEHFDQPLERIFSGTDRTLRSTRGVVMALARFDLEANRFSLASIGNVEPRLWSQCDQGAFVLRRGVVGANAPGPVVTQHEWMAKSVLVLHSDGLHGRWQFDDLPRDLWTSASRAAHELLQKYGKDNDDATVVVIRSTLQ